MKLDGADTSDAEFTVADMAPGDDAAAEIALTKDTGSVDIAKVGFKSELISGPSAFGDDLFLEVYEDAGTSDGETCTGGTEVTGDIESALSLPGDLTVDDFTGFFDSLFDGTDSSPAVFSNSSDNDLCLRVIFDTDADNSLQGATADVTFTFKGLQDSTQTP